MSKLLNGAELLDQLTDACEDKQAARQIIITLIAASDPYQLRTALTSLRVMGIIKDERE